MTDATPPSDPRQGDGPMVFVDTLDDPTLSQDDHHHLGRVLRVRDGEPIVVCDGSGSWRPARFGSVVESTGPIVTVAPRTPSITLGFALVKGDRPELVVQKLTELGVDRIVPFTSDHCVVRWDASRAAKQQERFERIAREASMQCRRTHLPEVVALTTFAEVVRSPSAPTMIADLGGVRLDARSLGEGAPGAAPTILIGPEGGWSDAERSAVTDAVRIGDHVLRAETAAIAAATLLAALRANAAPTENRP